MKTIYPSVFLEHTKELLRNKPSHITYVLIAEETGLKPDWLESLLLKRNKDKLDPGIRKIERLYNYLSNEPFSFSEKENDE